MKRYRVAIVGIRGAVGAEMLKVLEQRRFPVEELRPMSSHPEECPEYRCDGRSFRAVKLTRDAFEGIEIALFSPGAAVSREYAPSAVDAGAVVIDNTSQFRMDPEVPLVVPEVNPHAAERHRGLIANPNCSTIQMVVALKPLHDFARIRRIVAATYQSVSGAGLRAIEELRAQLRGEGTVEVFPHRIAHNLIPQIDVPKPNGYTKEEMKMVRETRKILEDDEIRVTATCVRVPVFYAHAEAVTIETERKITRSQAVELLRRAPGVRVVDDLEHHLYPTPLDAEGGDETLVGRIREDISCENGLNLWIVADNLRKGAALNAVQIAELLIERGWLPRRG